MATKRRRPARNELELINPQRPFAYMPTQDRVRTKPIRAMNHYRKHLPSNYVGICISCGMGYQKFTGTPQAPMYCKRCLSREQHRYVVAIPPELTPWELISPRASEFTTQDFRFVCKKCGNQYFSLAVFGTLCKHKAHDLFSKKWFCRFCCTKRGVDNSAELEESTTVVPAPPVLEPPTVIRQAFQGFNTWNRVVYAQPPETIPVYIPQPGNNTGITPEQTQQAAIEIEQVINRAGREVRTTRYDYLTADGRTVFDRLVDARLGDVFVPAPPDTDPERGE